MISSELFQEIEIGQTVFIITGPGEFASDEMCSMQGPIIEKNETQWGKEIVIKVEKSFYEEYVGQNESIMTLHKVGERLGIGSYVQ